MRKLYLAALGLLLFVLGGTAPASATTFGFDCITGNAAVDCGIGEAQLFVDVTDATSGGIARALFTFRNTGPDASVIADVYFDDGTLAQLLGLIDADDAALGAAGDAGVDFSPGASPPDLPGGTNVGFFASAAFSSDADAPPPAKGVGPGETLGVLIGLQGSFADVLVDLATGDLRVGIHVQAFDSGGSESFVNDDTPTPIASPEPAVWLLGAAALAGALAAGRRRGSA